MCFPEARSKQTNSHTFCHCCRLLRVMFTIISISIFILFWLHAIRLEMKNLGTTGVWRNKEQSQTIHFFHMLPFLFLRLYLLSCMRFIYECSNNSFGHDWGIDLCIKKYQSFSKRFLKRGCVPCWLCVLFVDINIECYLDSNQCGAFRWKVCQLLTSTACFRRSWIREWWNFFLKALKSFRRLSVKIVWKYKSTWLFKDFLEILSVNSFLLALKWLCFHRDLP